VNETRYTLVKTGDGSYTLYLHEYDEHMHTLSGAYEEALLKHVRPSCITDKKKECLRVLDVGFGLGYNILALMIELHRTGYHGTLFVISLEKERSLLPALEAIQFDDDRDEIYSRIRNAYISGSSKTSSSSISVHFGDARNIISSLSDDTFDAVFFDPFSPSRNPELWSVDIFRHVYRVMDRDAILTTYSSAPQVRAAFLEAGFIISRGPAVGGKREGTLAAKTAIIPPLPAGDMELLLNNNRAVPYRDPQLAAGREFIIKERSDEIRRLRSKMKPK
jgi:tRNA U34 5-methylaminomethyl-2-thiouridine-forming methyltransferase MnmC